MGDYPTFGDTWRKRWVQLPNSRRAVLHRVAATIEVSAEQIEAVRATLHYADLRACVDDWDADRGSPRGIQGTTACGRSGRLGMPGIFSRMGAPRCKRCCKLTGVPYGDGAPFNDETLPDELQNA